MKINEIREARAHKVAEARSIIAAAEAAKRNLTANESAKFDSIKAEISDLEAQEARAAFLDAQDRAGAARVIEGGKDTLAVLESRASVLEAVRAQVEQRSLTGASAELHAELERRHGKAAHGGILVPMSTFEKRANDSTSGADLIANNLLAGQYIGPLRNSLLVRNLGVRVLPGLVGNVTIPKSGAVITTSWVADGTAPVEVDKTFSDVTMSPKHVAGITEMSRGLIMQSTPAIEALVRDDLSYAIAAAVDHAIIAGTGAANNQPQGILGRAGVQTVAAVPAAWADVLAAEQKLRGVNIIPSGWYTTTAVQTTLRGILKSNVAGAQYIAGLNNIGDLPSASSNAAPVSAASPNGQAILGDWSQVLVGEWGATEILANPFGDAFARGGVQVRAFASVDVQCRYENAFVVCG